MDRQEPRKSRPGLTPPPPADPVAVVYTRVSSEEQVGGTSLDTQEKACRDCAARLGLRVVAVHVDAGKSAKSVVGREALARAVADAKARRAALIVYKFDRLARNLGDAYQIRDALLSRGARVVSATEGEAEASPLSKTIFAVLAAIAEFDNDVRAERCKAGLHARAESGYWYSCAPFGYVLDHDERKRLLLAPDPDRAHLVRNAFDAVATGKFSPVGAFRILKGAGVSRAAAFAILRNPIYKGVICTRATDFKPVKAVFPGLVPEETFDAVQRILDNSTKGKGMKLKDNPAFPLVGVLVCGGCGRAMRAGMAVGRGGRKYGYYWCASAGKEHAKIRADEAHAAVAGLLLRMGKARTFFELIRDHIDKLALSADKSERDEAAARRRRLGADERRLERSRDLLLRGTITEDEYLRDRQETQARIAEARAWLAGHDKIAERRAIALDALVDLFREPERIIETLPPRGIKELCRILFGQLRVTAAKTIEPPEASVFTAVCEAESAKNSSGGPGWT